VSRQNVRNYASMAVFVIALYALRAQQSDVADVTANNKPGDDTEPNDHGLSRVVTGRSREELYEAPI
jgi:hypothetical protein